MLTGIEALREGSSQHPDTCQLGCSQVEVVATGDESTDQKAMQQEVRQIQKRKGNLRVVQGQGFQLGDTAVVDFEAKRADTGEAFPQTRRVKTQLDSDSSDVQFLPGGSLPSRTSFTTLCSCSPSGLECAALGMLCLAKTP